MSAPRSHCGSLRSPLPVSFHLCPSPSLNFGSLAEQLSRTQRPGSLGNLVIQLCLLTLEPMKLSSIVPSSWATAPSNSSLSVSSDGFLPSTLRNYLFRVFSTSTEGSGLFAVLPGTTAKSNFTQICSKNSTDWRVRVAAMAGGNGFAAEQIQPPSIYTWPLLDLGWQGATLLLSSLPLETTFPLSTWLKREMPPYCKMESQLTAFPLIKAFFFF